MPSTYSTNLALELMATGDQSGSWGATTNTNLGTLIEQAISGYVTQAITDGADTTITIPNGATGVARNMAIEGTGALTNNRNLIVPANKKLYFFYNNTTGGFAVTVKVSGQTGVSVPNGKKMALVCNGTDVVELVTFITNFAATNADISNVRAATYRSTDNGSTNQIVVPTANAAPTIGGSAIITVANAAATLPTTAKFPAGGIVMWSGSIGTIPTGWALCDGTSGTPDLRDRFIVGAGSTYAVAATGGATSVTTSSDGAGATITVAGTALTEAQLPAHGHPFRLSTTSAVTSRSSPTGGIVIVSTGDGGTLSSQAAYSGAVSDTAGQQIGGTGSGATHTHTATITSHTHTAATLPPYYALAYIMKLAY